MDYSSYYQVNIREFSGEDGHEKLLSILKPLLRKKNEEKSLGLDIGSCIGNYIPNLEEMCAELILFEPNPVNNEFIKNMIKRKTNIQLYKIAISDQNYSTEFYNFDEDSNNNTGNGLACLRGRGKKICDVDVKRIDTILNDLYPDIPIRIKFIKIDTEGNDGNVIKGIGKYLKDTDYIIFESSSCLDDFRGPGIPNPLKDIINFLSSEGFDTYKIGTKKLLKMNDESWLDIFETKKPWSNSFSLKKGDNLIEKLIDKDYNYLN